MPKNPRRSQTVLLEYRTRRVLAALTQLGRTVGPIDPELAEKLKTRLVAATASAVERIPTRQRLFSIEELMVPAASEEVDDDGPGVGAA